MAEWRRGDGRGGRPPAGGLDAIGWRVGPARITGDVPFSTFHIVDRTSALLDGGGLVLTVGAGPQTRPGTDAAPLRFVREAPCRCRLLAGPATALNVMTERTASARAMVASVRPVAEHQPDRGP